MPTIVNLRTRAADTRFQLRQLSLDVGLYRLDRGLCDRRGRQSQLAFQLRQFRFGGLVVLCHIQRVQLGC